jgi:hypothetical protein
LIEPFLNLTLPLYIILKTEYKLELVYTSFWYQMAPDLSAVPLANSWKPLISCFLASGALSSRCQLWRPYTGPARKKYDLC